MPVGLSIGLITLAAAIGWCRRMRANRGEVFGKTADYQAFGCSVAW